MINSYSKILLFSVSIAVFLSQTLDAGEILVRYKTGETGVLEVIGVVGQSVRLKNTKTGNLKNFRLTTFDEGTLIRIITDLGKQLKPSNRATPPSSRPATVNGKPEIRGGTLEFQMVKVEQGEDPYLHARITNKSGVFISSALLKIPVYDRRGGFLCLATFVINNLKPNASVLEKSIVFGVNGSDFARIEGRVSVATGIIDGKTVQMTNKLSVTIKN